MTMTTETTPMVQLCQLNDLRVYAKMEDKNPSGSIKYRIAKSMVDDAEARGVLRPGMGIIEASSGNTGIALAYIGLERDYPVVIITGRDVTKDAKRLMRDYGADVVEVDGYFNRCQEELRKIMDDNKGFYYWPNQCENKISLRSNEALGNEILQILPNVDFFVASMGTGSTISGVGHSLKAANINTQVCLVLPEGHYDVPGVDDYTETTVDMPLFDKTIIDREIRIGQKDAIRAAKKLRDFECYVGVSTGAVFAAIEKLSQNEARNAVMLLIDSGDRYHDIFGAE